ncbi:MAG: hypothetical protein IKL57_06030 [Oscillospiraceae bacterium]|nr:hypothetical protein [Oscillospiraceae bacterium]
MNKTIALFVAVIAVIIIGSIYSYINLPEPIVTKELKVEEIKNKEPEKEKVKTSNSSSNKKSDSTQAKTYVYEYPCYGMDEKYIEKTRLGKADKVESTYDVIGSHIIITKSYIWLNSNGTYRAYAITGEDLYEEGKRMVYSFTDCSKKTYYSSSKGSSKSDPYNAKDYGYADDFYDEYYDDFYDYEDAEDYWMWNQ